MGKLQFIVVPHPASASSAGSQKLAHSHAARAAHARNRHLRILEYQAHKSSQKREHDGLEAAASKARNDGRNTSPQQKAVELPRDANPSPMSLLSSGRRDPFDSFATSLRPMEQFLFDYCEFIICRAKPHTPWAPQLTEHGRFRYYLRRPLSQLLL